MQTQDVRSDSQLSLAFRDRVSFRKLDGTELAAIEADGTVSGVLSSGGLDGGATVADQTLKAWTSSEAFEPSGTISRDANDVPTGFDVVWPDGSDGTFTTTANDTTTGAIDSFTITHTDSGKTVTQAAVTRNADSAVTVKPALEVA